MEVLFAGMLQEILSFCYKIEDVSEVMTGIGLQIVRVSIQRQATYLFLTRSIEKSRPALLSFGSFQFLAVK
ncbi:unnamed protein product [Linum tenue]|uniref:Uncharacterized protein n=1 Tax=Linum tenue TaxID=586396 RepID=A0AAV0IRS1_9ROSI|nr:unnamed protein product [Linum tenue]